MPRLSIVLVSLNAGEDLCETVYSIIHQTYTDWELIIKDGLSIDDSFQKLPQDKRIFIYQSEDQGIFDAINQGLEYITGEYTTFMFCGDPYLNTDVLQQVMDYIEHSNCNKDRTVFYGNAAARYRDSIVQFGEFTECLCFDKILCHAASFFPSKLFAERKYNTKYRVTSDYEYYVHAYTHRQVCMKYMPITVVFYKGNGYSENEANIQRGIKEVKEIRTENFSGIICAKYRLLRILSGKALKDYISQVRLFTPIYHKIRNYYYRVFLRKR